MSNSEDEKAIRSIRHMILIPLVNGEEFADIEAWEIDMIEISETSASDDSQQLNFGKVVSGSAARNRFHGAGK